jgi:transcriptional regulator with GAF, ATPase, and Fis domain
MGDCSDSDTLRTAVDELRTINNLLGKISQVRESNHIMTLIIGELVRATSADQGIINLVESIKGEELTTVVRNTSKGTEELPYKVASQISGWVLTNRQLLRIDTLERDGRFAGLSSEDGRIESVICCPMIARGDIIGLTTIVRSRAKGPFADGDCRLAGILTSQSAHILSNALLLEKLARNNELLEISQKKLKEENARLRIQARAPFQFESIIGKSPAIKRAMVLVSKFGAHDSPVLVTGGTGTGKELIARAIHAASARRDKPFVVKNCSVKTESLLESELFGHVKGSFTGAIKDKIGLFREADGGTIFLDEIADAPLSTQAAILRVIQNGEIRPIGAARTEFVNVRIISATNKELKELIKKGEFREDLYYRLNTFMIDLPPLAQRKEDIPLLVAHFLEKLRVGAGGERLSLTPGAMEILTNYAWPGNVRQLEHELERASAVCDSDSGIDVEHLSPEITRADTSPQASHAGHGRLRDMVERLEREVIATTLRDYKGNILQVSKVLGLTRKGLKDKMARYDIRSEKE